MPANLELYNIVGLSPEDHSFLDGIHYRLSRKKQAEIFNEERIKHAGDPVALEQINIYDSNRGRYTKLRKSYDAFRSEDPQIGQNLQWLLEERHPNI